MSFETKKLREERAGVIKEVQKIWDTVRAEGKDTLTPEQREIVDRLDARHIELKQQYEDAERLERFQSNMMNSLEERHGKETINNLSYTNNPVDAYDKAITAWMMKRSRDNVLWNKAEEFRPLAERCGINIDADSCSIALRKHQPKSVAEIRGTSPQSTSTNLGGELIPSTLANFIEVALLSYGNVLSVCNVLRTPSGETFTIPTVNDVSNQATIITESTGDTVTDVATNKIQLASYMLTTGLVKVTMELARDSAFPAAGFVADILATRFARGVNYYATLGSGSNMPQGYTVGAGTAANVLYKSSIQFSELVSAFYSIDPAYRNSPSFAWIGDDTFISAVSSIVDEVSRPIFIPSMQPEIPDRLFGRPLLSNNQMANEGTLANKVCTLGDWSKFVVRLVGNYELASSKERYFENRQIVFCGLGAMDSKVLTNAALKNIVAGNSGA